MERKFQRFFTVKPHVLPWSHHGVTMLEILEYYAAASSGVLWLLSVTWPVPLSAPCRVSSTFVCSPLCPPPRRFSVPVRLLGLPGDSVVKNMSADAGDTGNVGFLPGSGRSPRVGNGNPLQNSCWEIPWTEEPDWLESLLSQSQKQLTSHTHITLLRFFNSFSFHNFHCVILQLHHSFEAYYLLYKRFFFYLLTLLYVT